MSDPYGIQECVAFWSKFWKEFNDRCDEEPDEYKCHGCGDYHPGPPDEAHQREILTDLIGKYFERRIDITRSNLVGRFGLRGH